MKITFRTIAFVFVLTALALVACSGGLGGETATIIIDLGSPASSKEAVNVAELSHTVVLSGPSGSRTLSISGNGRASASVAPGLWVISVTAYYQGAVYAIGSASVEVRAYQTASVTVFMTVVWGEETQGGGGGGSPSLPSLPGYAKINGDNWLSIGPPSLIDANYIGDSTSPQDNGYTVNWYSSTKGLILTTTNVDINGSPPWSQYTVDNADWNDDVWVVISHPGYSNLTSNKLRICRAINLSDWNDFTTQATPDWNWLGNSFILYPGYNPTVSTPVGSYTDQFTGYFDGNGCNSDVNLGSNMNSLSDQYAGLFAYIAPGGIVKNITLLGSVSTTTGSLSCYVGGVAGVNEGTILNVAYDQSGSGSVTGSSTSGVVYVGGIAGHNANGGIIKNCFANVLRIEASTSLSSYAGGIAGVNDGAISFSWVEVDDTTDGIIADNSAAGGIAGKNASSINNCVVLGGWIQLTNADASVGRIWGDGSGTGSANYVAYSRVELREYNSYAVVTVTLTSADNNTSGKHGGEVNYNPGSPSPPDAAEEDWWKNSAGWLSVWNEDSDKRDENKPWAWYLVGDRPEHHY